MPVSQAALEEALRNALPIEHLVRFFCFLWWPHGLDTTAK